MPGVATRKTRLHGRKPSAAWLHATSLQKMVGRDANDHAQAEKKSMHRAPFAKGGSTKMHPARPPGVGGGPSQGDGQAPPSLHSLWGVEIM